MLTCYRDNSRTSCYLRPDFLLNFITVSATRKQAERVFDRMFPTLVGITISHHVTSVMCDAVHKSIADHRNLPSSRIKAKVGTMSTLLMTQRLPAKYKQLTHFLDEELERTDSVT